MAEITLRARGREDHESEEFAELVSTLEASGHDVQVEVRIREAAGEPGLVVQILEAAITGGAGGVGAATIHELADALRTWLRRRKEFGEEEPRAIIYGPDGEILRELQP